MPLEDIFPILKSHLVFDAGGGRKVVRWENAVAGALGFLAALLLMHGVKSLGLEDLELGETVAPGDTDSEAASPFLLPRKAESEIALLEAPLLRASSPPRQERLGLKLAVARLTARTAALGQLARDDEDVDREAVDEEVHSLDFLIDVARRRCHSDNTEPVDPGCAVRLRLAVADLNDHVSSCRSVDPSDMPGIDAQLQLIAAALRRIHSHAEQRAVFRRWAPRYSGSGEAASPPQPQGASPPLPSPLPLMSEQVAAPAVGPMPWGLVLAVLIDSIVDGMLIGLAGSVSLQSGWLMAIATAIEMGFLGFSFACAAADPAMRKGGLPLKLLVLGLPPVAMVAASSAVALFASDVQDKPVFVGMMAFALAALLFLVVEELLLEAHEKEGSDEWHISVWLYVGLLLSICLDVAA
mmetsp:Transcript_46226/g.118774  ORF Transcript_46226/g.118774 Transcript_46226/m.118774 type:complete len:411 (+) Transcript_46226:2-1234(+)